MYNTEHENTYWTMTRNEGKGHDIMQGCGEMTSSFDDGETNRIKDVWPTTNGNRRQVTTRWQYFASYLSSDEVTRYGSNNGGEIETSGGDFLRWKVFEDLICKKTVAP